MPKLSENVSLTRGLMALIGVVAGGSLWFLAEELPYMLDNERLLMGVTTFAASFFAVLLGTRGPLPLRRAVILATLLGALGAGLVVWASFRFDQADDFYDSGHGMVAWFVLTTIPVPFLMAHLRQGEHWRDYCALFSHAWGIVVRYGVAWVFTGLFWGLLLLSNALLGLVGITVIEDVLDFDPVPFLVTGGALGLALAVVHELRDYISPHMVLRLLRLLLPMVLLVTVVFVVAAPLRGLSDLFGKASAASLLMAMALAAATLVTSALDRSDAEAATAGVITLSARFMAMILPLLGALAAWAIWLRVAQYGWTPARLAAALSAAIVLAYGVGYALAALRSGWRDHIRQTNLIMALAMVGAAALWLSPVLNPERLSTNSQIARFQAGKVSAQDLDLWSLGRDWGRAGQAGLAQLGAPEGTVLADRLGRLRQSSNRWQFETVTEVSPDAPVVLSVGDLRPLVPVRPIGALIPEAWQPSDDDRTELSRACVARTETGNPGCVALVADFLPLIEGAEMLILFLPAASGRSVASWTSGHGTEPGPEVFFSALTVDAALIDRALAGDFTLGPAPAQVVTLGDVILGIYP